MKIEKVIEKKKSSSPITMLTAYDYPFASILDQAEIDIILVGDSVANVVLGLESTKSVGMNEMIHHAKAVRRGVEHSLLVGDMPYESYQINTEDSLKNAKRFIDEAGCDAVKLEWFDGVEVAVRGMVNEGIQVMGHIGLTPQTADKLGGFKVQGRDADTASRLIDQALLFQELGVFSIVLECIPDALAEIITKKLKIPTIGIGAGVACDGQVLVLHDLLGLFEGFRPKFIKQYVDLKNEIKTAVDQYKHDVESRAFPSKEHSYSIKQEELDKLKRG